MSKATIIHLDVVDSTNSFAQELLTNHIVENGTVIVARNQTNGKGQRGSVWLAEAGSNLTFSVIFLPESMPSTKQFLLNKALCLAIYNLLTAKGFANAAIKWPNDVLVNKKKIAGILIENALRGNYIQSVIAGFGINVNQNNFGNGLKETATSMRLQKGSVFILETLLEETIQCIQDCYKSALKNDNDQIESNYTKALYQSDVWAMYETNNKEFLGCIRGVNDGGQLMVENKKGEILYFANKEIKLKF